MPSNRQANQLQTADRVTRRCLIGTGIISGLELALDEKYRICITAGKGITSNGEYIELSRSLLFPFYREYASDKSYPLFTDKDGHQVPLWELIIEENYRKGDHPLSPQYTGERLNPFLKDKVVLIYLSENTGSSPSVNQSVEDTLRKKAQIPEGAEPNPESNENSPGDHAINESSDQDSDPEYPYHLHFLLIRQDDLLSQMDLQSLAIQMVWNRLEDDDDYIYSDGYNPDDDRPRLRDINLALNPALRLPNISLRRFGFSKGDPMNCPPEGVDQSEFPPIRSLDDIYQGYRPAIDEAIGSLDQALRDLYHCFKNILVKYPVWDILDTLDILCDKWEAFKQKNQSSDLSQHNKEYIQYFYDWIRDLLAAYHELRQLLIEFTFISVSGAGEYPFHLLVGLPAREELTEIPKPFRQAFKQPPVYNGQGDRLPAIRLYFWRLLVMIKNFYLPAYIDSPDLARCNIHMDDPEEDSKFQQLKITPGRYYDQPLGNQSIPYYYYPIARHRYSLHHFWNVNLTRASNTDQILSFHANDTEDSYTDQLSAIRPLHYNLDAYPFFRIEGHIGQPLMENTQEGETIMGVLDHLYYLKQKYNLDFGIIALPLSQTNSLSYTYPEQILPPETFESFYPQHLGMAHLGGVQKGGAFVIVYDEDHRVIADFSLSYRCCQYHLWGKITDCLTGDAVNSVTITAESHRDSAKKQTTITDKNGRYQFSLPTGIYSLVAEKDNFNSFTEEEILLDRDRQVAIQLENKFGQLKGELTGEPPLSSEQLDRATIQLSSVDGNLSESPVNENGIFQFSNISVGAAKLTLVLKVGNENDVVIDTLDVNVLSCKMTTVSWVLQAEIPDNRPDQPSDNEPSRPGRERLLRELEEIKESAPVDKKDPLSKIRGIGKSTEKILYDNSILTFSQMSKMKMGMYVLLDPPLPSRVVPNESWTNEATKLAKNSN